MAPRSKKKPLWIVEKERQKSAGSADTVWLFGLHAVRDALENPLRERIRLMVTKNASDKLSSSIITSGIDAEIIDPRKFNPPIDPQSVHQGAALEVKPLDWGNMSTVCAPRNDKKARLVILDRVTDPHNVGAILRSAEVFGARAVIAQHEILHQKLVLWLKQHQAPSSDSHIYALEILLLQLNHYKKWVTMLWALMERLKIALMTLQNYIKILP